MIVRELHELQRRWKSLKTVRQVAGDEGIRLHGSHEGGLWVLRYESKHRSGVVVRTRDWEAYAEIARDAMKILQNVRSVQSRSSAA